MGNFNDFLGRGDLWRRRRVAVDHEQGFFLLFYYIFSFFFTIFFLSFFNRLRTRWRALRPSSSRHQDSPSPSRLRRWTQRLCFPFLLFHRIVFVANSALWSNSSNFQWNCYRLLLIPTPWGTTICYLKYMLYYIVWYKFYQRLNTPTPRRTTTERMQTLETSSFTPGLAFEYNIVHFDSAWSVLMTSSTITVLCSTFDKGSNLFDCRLEYELEKQIEKMELVRNFLLELTFNCRVLQNEALCVL